MCTEIPVLRQHCFGWTLRYGLLLWAYAKLLPNGIVLYADFWEYNFIADHRAVDEIVQIRFGLSLLVKVLNVFVTFLLIVAAHKRSVKLLSIFDNCESLSAAANFVLVASNGVLDHFYFSRYCVEWDTCRQYIVMQTLTGLLHVGLQIYMIYKVRSEILRLESIEDLRFPVLTTETEDKQGLLEEDQQFLLDTTDDKQDMECRIKVV